MLQIGYLIICDEVIQDPNQLIIRKPLTALTPLNLPGNFSFRVAFSLYNFNEQDFGKDNKVRVTFKDPDDKIVLDTGELNMKTDPNNATANSSLEIAEADMGITNVDLFKKGIYTLTLTVNEDFKELKIPVLKRPTQGD